MDTGDKDPRTSKTRRPRPNDDLQRRLAEAEQTLQAIRNGEVDAIVVAGPVGDQIYSLTGAEHAYRVIVETMNEAALTVDPDGTILFCNQRFCDLMRTPMPEVLGRKVTGFAASPQRPTLKAMMAATQAGPIQQHLTLRAADGTVVPVLLSASLLQTPDSVSICLVASDLTELEESANSVRVLREQRQALEESEARFRTIFESSQDAIVIADDEGVYIQANLAVKTIFDLSPEQLIGRRVSDFVSDAVEFSTIWREFLATGSFRGEMPLTGADGQARCLEVYAVANILPGRHLWVLRDVTERALAREAQENANEQLQVQAEELQSQAEELRITNEELRLSEQALRESREDLNRAQAVAHTGSWRLDTRHNVLLWSDETYRIFGLPQGTPMTYETFLAAVHPNDREYVDRQWTACLRGGPYDVEHRILVDGAVKWVRQRAELEFDSEGAPRGGFGTVQDITERKQAEEALRMSEEKFRTLYALSPIAIALNRLDNGQFLESNRALWKMTGYTEEEFRSLTYWDITPIEYQDMEAKQSDLLHTVGRYGPYEKEYIRKDGTRFPVLLSGVRITDPGGTDLIYSVIQDITELKDKENALREAKEYAENLIQAANVMVVGLDENGDVRVFNEAAEQITGYSRDEMVGRNWFEVLAPQQRYPWVREEFARLQAGGAPKMSENPILTKSGAERVIAWQNNTIRTNDRITGTISFGIDITERKRSEQALRESEERFYRLFEDDLTGDFISTPEGRILLCNPAFAKIFGFSSAQEAVGTLMLDLYIDTAGRELLVERLERQGKIERLEVWRKRRDGEPIYVVENLVGHVNDRGELYEIKGYVFDDTERKRAEESLLELTRTLETRVAERTAELEFRARQLQKLALELSQAEERERRRLAEILHDDLQQQLAAAKFHVGILAGRARGNLAMQKSAAQIDRMLKDAVETSRNLSHELSPAVMYHGDLGEILEWLANQIRAKHGLIVHVDAYGEINTQSDALKTFLFKAVQEMLFNAVKHARVSEARVRVRRMGRYICLSVSDRGRGFDPQELRQTAGFGLMSIRERIGLLGGRMRIHSVRGEGSRFIITVPDGELATDSELAIAARPAAKTGMTGAAADEAQPKRTIRVLIADDHEIVRQGLASLLDEAEDVEVVGEAANGREAVDMAYQLRPDVVIMDVAMPLMSGEEATKQIRKHLPQTRIVALSMYDEAGMIDRMHRAGAESYVLKTAPADELFAAVRGTP